MMGLLRGVMLIGFTLNVNPINIPPKEVGSGLQLACLQGFRDTIKPRLWAGSVVTRMVPSQR